MTKKTILSVDDSASIRQMVALALERNGYAVAQAGDGQEGLNRLKGGGIDLVITDINMPRMDGIELIRQVRALPGFKFLPIVILTTESEDAKKQAGRAAGATAWIVKPFNQEQLVAVVKKVLG